MLPHLGDASSFVFDEPLLTCLRSSQVLCHGDALHPPALPYDGSRVLGQAREQAARTGAFDTVLRTFLTVCSEKEQALSLLYRLHILTVNSDPGQPQSLRLTNPFAQSLRLALTGGGKQRSFGVPCGPPEKQRVESNFLDAFARSQWESILHYMVGSTGVGSQPGAKGPSPGVRKLLEVGGLVETKGGRPEITQAGFAFLLQEVNAQVWTLLVFYLENAEGVSRSPVHQTEIRMLSLRYS